MNKTTAYVLGALAIVLVIGALIFYSGSAGMNNDQANTTATSTSTGTDNTADKTPSAPVALTDSTVQTTDTTAIVSGKVTPDGAFTKYWYEYGRTESLGSKTSDQTVGSGYTSILAPGFISGLSRDTKYFFRLVAQNEKGKTTGATYSLLTTHSVPAPVGSVPTIQTSAANGITRSEANVNGQVLPNRASTTYWFEYGKTTNLGAISAFESVGNGTTMLPASAALAGLETNTTYYFRIDAQNQFGTVTGNTLTFKTLGPASSAAAVPAAVTRNSSAVATSTATLHGTVLPNNAETTYWFEYSTDSLLGSVLRTSTTRASAGAGGNQVPVTADISGLASKTTYYFRLVAQNNLGTTQGDRISFKTK